MVKDHSSIHWDKVGKSYRHTGSPLRPCYEDTKFVEEAVSRLCNPSLEDATRLLLFGVTPEISQILWPRTTQLLAVDQSDVMLRSVWPGNIKGSRWAVQGNWMNLPVADGSCDVIIGDGCFNCLDYPDSYRAVAASSHAALGPRGILITRVYVQPEEAETPANVFRALKAGEIGSFHAFKWRLAMALQENTQLGLRVSDIWRSWASADIGQDALTAMTGWPKEVVSTIEYYQDSEERYSFPTLAEFQAAISDYFKQVRLHFPAYELGEQCPMLVFGLSDQPR
jgi:hypothetical protein